MDDETLAPQEAPDDDLLDWVPPELEQRAILAAEKDAGIYRSKKIQRKRKEKLLDSPPAGRHGKLALAFLLGAALLLVLGTILAATGANGQQALQEKTQLGFALWMSCKAATLCVLLLFFLPLDQAIRRPVMFTMMCAVLIFNLAGELVGNIREVTAQAAAEAMEGTPMEVLVASAVVLSLLSLAIHPDLWLLLGLARRKSREKLAAVVGCISVFGCLMMVISNLIKPETALAPIYLTAIDGLLWGCYVALLFTWPVLERPVSTNPPAITISEGEETDGQPE